MFVCCFLCQIWMITWVRTSCSEWLVLYSFGHKVCSTDSPGGLLYPSSRPSFTLQIMHKADSLAHLQTCVSIWEPSKQNSERSAKLLMSDPGNWRYRLTWTHSLGRSWASGGFLPLEFQYHSGGIEIHSEVKLLLWNVFCHINEITEPQRTQFDSSAVECVRSRWDNEVLKVWLSPPSNSNLCCQCTFGAPLLLQLSNLHQIKICANHFISSPYIRSSSWEGVDVVLLTSIQCFLQSTVQQLCHPRLFETTVFTDCHTRRPFHKTPLVRRRAQHYRHTDNIIGGFGSCFTGISPVSGCGVAHNTLMFICAQVRGSDLAVCDLHTQELLPAPLLPAPLQLQHL